MKSIIFLEIDGVINTQYGLDASMRTRGETHDSEERAYFCKDATDNITKLLQHYSAEIVLINWKKVFKNVTEANKFFKSRGLDWSIIGFTPVLTNSDRGNEILKWMEKNGTPENYLIINSDGGIGEYFSDQLIEVNSLSGFADRKLYRKAMNILKRPATEIALPIKEEKELF